MAKAYRRLGMDDLAKVADNVQRENAFPEDLDRRAAKKDSWWKFWN